MTTTNALWNTPVNASANSPTLLLVDDDRIMRVILRTTLQQQGYEVLTANTGNEALAILQQNPEKIDTLVLDREMPGMNGLELVGIMKKDPKLIGIPIIMLTGSAEPEKIQEGIDAGVYYYLVKPADNTLLRSVIESALRERTQKVTLLSELSHHGAALKAMAHCQISISTITEAEHTSCFLASCFPDPERVVVGLMELLVNAIEHGSLGITYEMKDKLLSQNSWRQELDRRAQLPENAGKTVDVVYQRKPEGYLVQITDSGNGFDWKKFWHINPARATASHGRGIARARLMSFDRLAYNEKGNVVTAMVVADSRKDPSYAW